MAGICAIIGGASVAALAEKANLKTSGVSSYLKLADGGYVYKVEGSLDVTYKDYVVTGAKGEFYRPPEGNKNATTRSRVVITKNAHVAKTGTDAFELTAQQLVDMDLQSESIIARGGVEIKSGSTVINAQQLDGGSLASMRAQIEKAAGDLGTQYAAIVAEWLGKAGAQDRVMLLTGDVKATDPEFTFSGNKLVVNTTQEIYLFLGPHVVEMNIKEEGS